MYEQVSTPDPNTPERRIDGITHRAIDKRQVAEHLGLSPDASKQEILAEVSRRAQEHEGDFLWQEEFEAALGIDAGTLVSPGARPEEVRMARVQAVDKKLSNMLTDEKTLVRLNSEPLTMTRQEKIELLSSISEAVRVLGPVSQAAEKIAALEKQFREAVLLHATARLGSIEARLNAHLRATMDTRERAALDIETKIALAGGAAAHDMAIRDRQIAERESIMAEKAMVGRQGFYQP